jgi:hypothetical protein
MGGNRGSRPQYVPPGFTRTSEANYWPPTEETAQTPRPAAAPRANSGTPGQGRGANRVRAGQNEFKVPNASYAPQRSTSRSVSSSRFSARAVPAVGSGKKLRKYDAPAGKLGASGPKVPRKVPRAAPAPMAAAHNLTQEVDPEGEPDPYDAYKEYVFIKDIKLMINGNCPDQFQGQGDKYESHLDFTRLLEVQGLLGRNVTNSLTATLFNRNAYIAAYNLSSSPNPSIANCQPSVAATNSMVLKVNFSDNLPHELTMIVWTQMSSNMTLDNRGKVGLSYFNVYNK